jgi:hypothetical protein
LFEKSEKGTSWLGIMSRLKGTGRNVGDRTQKHFSGEMPALFVTVITREDLLLVLVDQGSESIHVELLTTMSLTDSEALVLFRPNKLRRQPVGLGYRPLDPAEF